MKFKTFALFVGPSVLAMLALIALPLVGVTYISLYSSSVKTEIVEVKTQVPVFAGVVQEVVTKVPQPVLDENGNPVKSWDYVGLGNIESVLATDQIADAIASDNTVDESVGTIDNLINMYYEIVDVDFWAALEFTLLYTLITLPAVLALGFLLAMSVHRAANKHFKGSLIFATLLPMIVTPLVGSLSIYWLFLDNGVMSSLLQMLGLGKVYFLKDAFSIRSLIILYGIWSTTPFAFIIFYAGLQTVAQDSLEAANLDGATPWQQTRYVILPHLAPLMIFVSMIHVMDAYRIFEPVLVFGSNLFANSLQYLTYHTLYFEDNFNKAAASAVLTVIGVAILLIPAVIRNWREHKRGH
ncbi:MAG: sugar ABC transporter permease [Marinobacterium sp.]|nr:sugar ABC transporter permease [Marinobacterium sp.]